MPVRRLPVCPDLDQLKHQVESTDSDFTSRDDGSRNGQTRGTRLMSGGNLAATWSRGLQRRIAAATPDQRRA